MNRKGHVRLGLLAALVAAVISTSAAEYTADTSATKWSAIAASEWSPSAFVSDAASTGTVTATGASFAFDTAFTAAKVALVAGADLSVTMSTVPSVGQLELDGSSHLLTFASSLPGKNVRCKGDVKITERYPTTGLVLDILDGTTTLACGNSQFHVENKWITLNVRGGLLQCASGHHIYTGFTGGAHQYFNICGGKMTARLAIANNNAQGIHVNVTSGEFAPTAINYSDGSAHATDYQRDCVPIALSGGTFSVPSALPIWAPVTTSGTAGAIRSDTPGGSKVYSTITIPADAALSLVPGEGGLTLLTDVKGAGTLIAADGCLRPMNTNRFEGAIQFVTGKKLVFDTSLLTGAEGAIFAEGGFIFPAGKTIADIAEFVTLPNPYTFELSVGADNKSLFARRTGSVTYTVTTTSSTWSGIAASEWQPHAFYDDKGSTVKITTSAATFAVDDTITVGELRIASGGTPMTGVTFPGAVTCDHIVIDGADGKVTLSSLPRNLEFDGTVEISTGSPASKASSIKVLGGTTTLTASRVNIENCTFTMSVTGGVLTTKNGDVYTGHQQGAIRTYNVSGGTFSCLLTVPNQNAYLRNYINVSGGDFAPKGIKYSAGSEAGSEYVNDIFAITMTGGRFSVPAVLPRWAPVAVNADIEMRAQSASKIRGTITIADGKTLSVASDSGAMTFCGDFAGTGTLALNHDVTWDLITTNRIAGALRFASGTKITIDTTHLAGDEGAIIVEGGFVFPSGKSVADLAEFVVLANPNAYCYTLAPDGKTIVVRTLGPVDYVGHTAASAWSAIPSADWSPAAFVSDAASSVDLFTQGSAFNFDTAITCDALKIINEGGQNCDLTFGKVPSMNSILLYGSNGTLKVKSPFPSGMPMRLTGDVSVDVYQPGSAGCSRMDILGGTTTLVGSGSMVHIENINFTINLYDGILQNSGNVCIYTGFTGDNHQYFNIFGGKMTSRLSIANANSRGSHVNLYAGEFAPTSIDRLGTPAEYSGTALPIRLMGGTFSVPASLPEWAPVEVVSNATMRAQGNGTVSSVITVDADRTLTIAPSVSGGRLAFANDITGAGSVQVQESVMFQLVSTNTISVPFALGAGTTLTIDTSAFDVEEGSLTFSAGLTPPPGKTMADVAEFVLLANPYGYEYELLPDGKTFVVRSRGAISYVADTEAASWSTIDDAEWSPIPFVSEVKNLVTVHPLGASFNFDTTFVSDKLRVAGVKAEGASVSFAVKPTVNELTIDGSNGLIKVASPFPALSPVRLCGDVSITAHKPGNSGCSRMDILGGTTTLVGYNNEIHIENIGFTISLYDGLLQNSGSTYIYTGFMGYSHQYFNIFGGKMTSRLAIANHRARGSHVNVYDGEFAPTAINFRSTEPGDWRTNYNGTAVAIRLNGGVFSVPPELPRWAAVEVVSNATIRAQGNATVYSEVTIGEGATLTVAESAGGGTLTLLRDVAGAGTLEVGGDLIVQPQTTLAGRLQLCRGHRLSVAIDDSMVTGAVVTAVGGVAFKDCPFTELPSLVRFTGPRAKAYSPDLRGNAIWMCRIGTCIRIR